MYFFNKELEENFVIKNNNGMKIEFLDNNKLHSIKFKEIMINQLETQPLENPLSNVWLRIKEAGKIEKAENLLFFGSGVETFRTNESVTWTKKINGLNVTATMSISADNTVFTTIKTENIGTEKVTFDLVYGQDLGLGHEMGLKTNEAYTNHYVDHKIFKDEAGYTICSRQNIPVGDINPFLQTGCFSKTTSFSTDGFQFFGKTYKTENEIEILTKDELANEKYQYEFAYMALKTEETVLEQGSTTEAVFYNKFLEHVAEKNVEATLYVEDIKKEYKEVARNGIFVELAEKFNVERVTSKDLSQEEIDALYPEREYEEIVDGELISFYTKKGAYITLQAKERLVERPTGHIILSGNFLGNSDKIISSVNYGFGVFSSQITVGNTSFNKLTGINRNPLNLQNFSGQRIFIKENGNLKQLAVPSVYEQGYNYSKWVYFLEDEKIEVLSFVGADTPNLSLEIRSEKTENFIVSSYLVLGNHEKESNILVERNGNTININGDNELVNSVCKNLNFVMESDTNFDILDSENTPYLMMEFNSKNVKLSITGDVNEKVEEAVKIDFATERAEYNKTLNGLINNFKVDGEKSVKKIGAMLPWYAHNAMVHFIKPHGLEQYSGAAWGTRDVSQGPLEFFLSTQNYEVVSKILKSIYSHQYIETGTWPQWFMFDRYAKIQQEECHGDIVVWPIKALANYITTTGDYKILEEKVPFTSSENGFEFTSEYTILDHLKKQIEYIKGDMLADTGLFSYGDGDWDDTLQPKNASLRKNMVSSWTMALLLESLQALNNLLTKYDIYTDFREETTEFYASLNEAFYKHSLVDGVVSGFSIYEGGEVLPMLHPKDDRTGIKYRLLPMIRGIISETFNKELADSHYEIIENNLMFPDGVRLMTEPIEYQGGKQDYFKRAELAANIGREIGLQYCHAHIRFIEALCKLGKGKEALENLLKLIPINLNDNLKNADFRQSNCYFSSSDGDFKDRYEFKEKFDELKAGERKVKGGWRIYSSGPGILINQIISNIYGIRVEDESLLLDPVLSGEERVHNLDYTLDNKGVKFRYHLEVGQHTPKRILINGQEADFTLTNNRYRKGGALLNKAEVFEKLEKDSNTIDIYL